jgi:4-cresol dehydrogenase (hydroxylating)
VVPRPTAAALDGFAQAVGPRHLVTDQLTLSAAGRTTYATHQRLAAIVRPETAAEVQAVMRVAHEHGVAVHPVSGGRNWGYGARVPVADGTVLLDLSRLDRIVAYDEELGSVTIEAGVTQAALAEYLHDAGDRCRIDANGSSPRSSLVGNLLARGFGATAYGDHVSAACGFEVVLADGSLVHTGYGAFPGSRVGGLDRWAPGPMIDGLFSQSNFGVVTKLTLWLMPAPERVETVMFEMDDVDALEACCDAVRRFRLDGTIRGTFWVGNHWRVVTALQQFPSDRRDVLSAAEGDALARELGIARWTGFVPLYGSPARVAVDRRAVRAALRGRARRLTCFDDRILEDAGASPVGRFAGSLHRAYSGRVVTGLPRAYWRKSAPVPDDPDPDRDNVGFIFCTAAVPLRGADIAEAGVAAEAVIGDHGFEPAINCIGTRDRAVQLLASIAYDREVPGADERAMDCYSELSASLTALGFTPFRLGVHSMAEMDKAEPGYTGVLRAIKAALDPGGIVAPGHYVGPPACSTSSDSSSTGSSTSAASSSTASGMEMCRQTT